jgi:hypothetical protein
MRLGNGSAGIGWRFPHAEQAYEDYLGEREE